MTLLELLVKELPSRGGWPEGVEKIGQDFDCELKFLGAKRSRYRSDIYTEQLCAGHRAKGSAGYGETVTREQYEAAIAAQQPVWNGEGLPPIGCDVEYDSYPDGWVTIGIVARFEDATFIVWKSGTHKGADIMRGRFPIERIRPIRTEADKKRDETLCAMRNCVSNFNNTSVIHAIEQCYDAIAAGKIPGVELSK